MSEAKAIIIAALIAALAGGFYVAYQKSVPDAKEKSNSRSNESLFQRKDQSLVPTKGSGVGSNEYAFHVNAIGGSGVARVFDRAIKFEQPFEKKPNVNLKFVKKEQTDVARATWGDPIILKVTEVTKDGFIIHLEADQDAKYESVTVHWDATPN